MSVCGWRVGCLKFQIENPQQLVYSKIYYCNHYYTILISLTWSGFIHFSTRVWYIWYRFPFVSCVLVVDNLQNEKTLDLKKIFLKMFHLKIAKLDAGLQIDIKIQTSYQLQSNLKIRGDFKTIWTNVLKEFLWCRGDKNGMNMKSQ